MLVYCGQTVGWINMPLRTEVGLGPGHIVLDGNPAPPKGAQQPPPTSRPMSIVTKRSPSSATAELLFNNIRVHKLGSSRGQPHTRIRLESLLLDSGGLECVTGMIRAHPRNACAPYSAGWNFRQYFYAIFLRLGHPLTSTENFTEIVPGEPLRRGWGEVNERGVAKYSDFGPIGGYISETVQDRI